MGPNEAKHHLISLLSIFPYFLFLIPFPSFLTPYSLSHIPFPSYNILQPLSKIHYPLPVFPYLMYHIPYPLGEASKVKYKKKLGKLLYGGGEKPPKNSQFHLSFIHYPFSLIPYPLSLNPYPHPLSFIPYSISLIISYIESYNKTKTRCSKSVNP